MTTGKPSAKVARWIEEHADGEDAKLGLDPRDFDPKYTATMIDRMGLLFGARRRWFRVDARGWENVPEAPAMLVSNHSGGTSIPDAWGLGFTWHTHFAMQRPLHVMAHELVFSVPQIGRMFARAGVLRAQPELGLKVLSKWKRDLLVMPGGDVDVWRPYRERYKVKFAGRRGYARLAIKADVPIVPVANAGAHETLRVLTDGEPVARMLHFPELFRANVFPVHLSFPWGLAIGPWPHLPPPARLRYRFGKPIVPEGGPLKKGEEPSPERVLTLDAQVQAAVQALLSGLEAEDQRGKRRAGRADLAAE
jgi:1-acyl-sn-glycerol-3-phosphate acyltransferase